MQSLTYSNASLSQCRSFSCTQSEFANLGGPPEGKKSVKRGRRRALLSSSTEAARCSESNLTKGIPKLHSFSGLLLLLLLTSFEHILNRCVYVILEQHSAISDLAMKYQCHLRLIRINCTKVNPLVRDRTYLDPKYRAEIGPWILVEMDGKYC